MTRLAIVMPCYNEQETLPRTLDVITGCLDSMVAGGIVSPDSYVLCVDDGSRDGTWDIIRGAHGSDARVKGIMLAHNRGQQSALVAGMETVMDRCDVCVTLDADLQDDPTVIPQMIAEYDKGADIVFGVRSSRDTDTWFKRNSAQGFYRVMRGFGIETVYNHAEFRLMSARALRLLAEYGERTIYLRGIVAQLGLRQATVSYPRAPRTAGESKYSMGKLIALAADGITSFTARPMMWILKTGLLLMAIDIIVAIWALGAYISGHAVSGWTSLILSLWFLGSLILISIGVLGVYIGKIYIETKQRPRYAVETELFD